MDHPKRPTPLKKKISTKKKLILFCLYNKLLIIITVVAPQMVRPLCAVWYARFFHINWRQNASKYVATTFPACHYFSSPPRFLRHVTVQWSSAKSQFLIRETVINRSAILLCIYTYRKGRSEEVKEKLPMTHSSAEQ
jgi:hypothetical protein